MIFRAQVTIYEGRDKEGSPITITHSVHENCLPNSEGTYRAVVESIRTIAFEGVLDRMMSFQ